LIELFDVSISKHFCPFNRKAPRQMSLPFRSRTWMRFDRHARGRPGLRWMSRVRCTPRSNIGSPEVGFLRLSHDGGLAARPWSSHVGGDL